MIKKITNSQKSPRIALLYVDDNTDDCLLLREAARHASPRFAVTTLTSVNSSISYLTVKTSTSDGPQDPIPHFVLINFSIGSHRGTDLLCWMRHHPVILTTPAIIYSDSDKPQSVSESYKEGANAFVKKAASLTRLVAILQTVLGCLASTPPSLNSLQLLPEYRPAPQRTKLGQ